MRFLVIEGVFSYDLNTDKSVGYLVHDPNSTDQYNTKYYLVYYDQLGNRHDVGLLKIGQLKWNIDQRTPTMEPMFDVLSDEYFSLGDSVGYYETLMEIEENERQGILVALRDVAYDKNLYERVLDDEVMKSSLMQFKSKRKVEESFRNILNHAVDSSPYEFTYIGPTSSSSTNQPFRIEFAVRPNSNPSTNVHTLVGGNGVGKTRLLKNMIQALVNPKAKSKDVGKFFFPKNGIGFNGGEPELFHHVVSVSFGAFDNFQEFVVLGNQVHNDVPYTHIGLPLTTDGRVISEKKVEVATLQSTDFAESLFECSHGSRKRRLVSAIEILEIDRVFREQNLMYCLEINDKANFLKYAMRAFSALGSGHKIVLLTITKLVQRVEVRSLVILDEPETHLHPPLLSSFVRVLSDLMKNRNGVAIVATHSPIVLQEVPRGCVWKIARSGNVNAASRPSIETFAESVGVLTREVFGLEVDASGFHKLIDEKVVGERNFSSVMRAFGWNVGSQGQALIRALIAHNTSTDNDHAQE